MNDKQNITADEARAFIQATILTLEKNGLRLLAVRIERIPETGELSNIRLSYESINQHDVKENTKEGRNWL